MLRISYYQRHQILGQGQEIAVLKNPAQVRSKSPYRRRDQSPPNRDPHENETRRIKCDYCKRTGHLESRCWFKQDDEAKRSGQPLNA